MAAMAACGFANLVRAVERPMTCGDDDIAAFVLRIRLRTSIAVPSAK
jgi:hypothetical protein